MTVAAGAPHFHGFGQVAKSIEKTAHRGLGCDATALGAANAVGDRRDDVAARLRQLPAENGAGEILVALARSGFRGEADAGLDAGKALSHRRCSDLLRCSRPCVECGLLLREWQLQFSSLQRS